MQSKIKVTLAVVLAVAAVFSVIHGITASSPKRNRAISPIAAVNQNQRSVSGETALPTKRLALRTQFKSWRRRPFVPVGTPGVSAAPLIISGIIAKGNIYKAMIVAAIVMKGDKVGSNTVVDVQKDKVILNDGTKDFELKIEK